MNITRTEYRKARRLLRENGEYAFQWLDDQTRAVFRAILFAAEDLLQGRAELSRTFAPELIPTVLKHDIRAAQDLRNTRPLAA